MSLPTTNPPPEFVHVVVRFSSSQYQDLSLNPIPLNKLSISWLRQSVRSKLQDLSSKRLRFILSGRVLSDATNFADEYHRFLRFNHTEDGAKPDTRFYVHCLIGDDLTAEELQKENELDKRVQEPSTTPAPVGFDRLASAGFSQEDIHALRNQFRQLYGDLPQGENRDIRQLEERWIDSTVNNEMDEFNDMNAGSSTMGGNEDLLIGVLVGCLLGVLSLFLLKEDGLFSKRQRMAIVVGFIINFSFALVRQWA